jgi:hypothetical protein
MQYVLMPRFFFHVVNDTFTRLDEHGTEIPNLAAACKEARKILGSILSDELCGTANLVHLTVMVDDASGHRVGNIKTVTRVVTATSPFAE